MKGFRSSARFILALAVLAGIAPGLTRDLSEADGSGCSREESRKPSFNGCIPFSGHVCYYCEYAQGGGYSVCYENVEGSVKFCVDYQTLPED